MGIYNFIWILISYLLGSIPFGYLVTKFSTKKNILEIGWRKTSGSNVFKNVGIWQGVITGLLDVAKGYLAVRLAQNFNLPLQIQALCGAVAVLGHNWSIFLKFAGGRGIGTFIGALYALSPQILGFSLIPLLFLALVWNASIGTIIFLITAIVLSFYPPPFLVRGQFEIVGIFTLISLVPIFIKRLSPIQELKIAQNRTSLIKNRLLFDDDIPPPEWRVKRIIRRLTKD